MKDEEIKIDYSKLSEFIINEDISVFYDEEKNIWFLEDYNNEGQIVILEDKKENIFLENDFHYNGVIITTDMLEQWKEIILKNS